MVKSDGKPLDFGVPYETNPSTKSFGTHTLLSYCLFVLFFLYLINRWALNNE
jgi:hypothetical protein